MVLLLWLLLLLLHYQSIIIFLSNAQSYTWQILTVVRHLKLLDKWLFQSLCCGFKNNLKQTSIYNADTMFDISCNSHVNKEGMCEHILKNVLKHGLSLTS